MHYMQKSANLISLNDEMVSVIIPTYNRADLINETIESVLSQTYKNIEILVCDDGSTDNTEQVVKAFKQPNIKYFKLEHKGFPASPRNHGLKEAQGEYIAFIDSDDLWESNKIEVQLNYFHKYPNILACSTNKIDFPIETKQMIKIRTPKFLSFNQLSRNNLIFCSSVMIRKKVIHEIGYFDENPDLRAAEDYDYWLRILSHENHSILLIPDKLLKYRIHTQNISDIARMDAYFLKFLPKYEIIFKKHEKKYPTIVRNALKNYQSLALSNKILYDIIEQRIGLKSLLFNKKITMTHKIKTILKIITGYGVKK